MDQGSGKRQAEVAQQLRDGLALNANLFRQDRGGLAGWGDPEDAVACTFPSVDASFQGIGLACAGPAEPEAKSTFVLSEVLNELALVWTKGGTLPQLAV
jgi:hypothetical protein